METRDLTRTWKFQKISLNLLKNLADSQIKRVFNEKFCQKPPPFSLFKERERVSLIEFPFSQWLGCLKNGFVVFESLSFILPSIEQSKQGEALLE